MDLTPARTRLAALLGVGALALTACGGQEQAAPASSSQPAAESSASAAPASSSAPAEASATSSASAEPSRADVTDAPKLTEALGDVRRNLREAESVTIDGDVVDAGSKMTVALSGAVDGSDLEGTVEGATEDFTGQVEFRAVDGVSYLQYRDAGGDEDIERVMGALDGRWLVDDQGLMPLEDLAPRVILEEVETAFGEATQAELEAVEEEVVTHDGEQMFRYSDDTRWSMIIDQDRNLRAFTEEGGDQQGIEFSDWNVEPTVQAPAKDEQVTIEQLQEELAGSASSSATTTS